MSDTIDKRSAVVKGRHAGRFAGPAVPAGTARGTARGTAATDDDPTGAGAIEEFGPYVVYERLGQGGMATVHRAEKRGVGIRRPIALKRLLPHVAADPELVKLFVDEARLASHLRHGNVAQTYELGKVGDTFFMAMEYASGPTLTQIARQCENTRTAIPIPVTVNILSQVCEALDHAHNLCDELGRSLHIIHRDVSPANIIVTNTGIVKLIDFGIAKATTSRVKTQTGFIKGKFGYIAPEYITGKIDARVDLFAVGVIAHEMLTGQRLFEGKDDWETMANIRDLEVQPPSRWNPQVSEDLDDIVMTALQRDPDARWRSAGAMLFALTNVARELGVVVGHQQLVEWVDWVFSLAGEPSVSIEIGVAGDSMEMVTPSPRSRVRAHSPSDSDETVPLDRARLTTSDIELLTPPPMPTALAPAPGPTLAPPRMVPRSSSHLEAVTPSPVPRGSRTIDAVAPNRAPSPLASQTLEAMPPPPPALPRVARKVEVIVARPASRSRTVVGLSLAMLALGAAAAAAAYYWPELWR